MDSGFTVMGIIFMATAWAVVFAVTFYSLYKVLTNNKFSED
jgi:hypothetical protein